MDILNVLQAAAALQVSPNSIRNMIRDGRLRASRIPAIRIARADLLALLDGQRIVPPMKPTRSRPTLVQLKHVPLDPIEPEVSKPARKRQAD